jgi:hypothetical protein
MAWWRLEWGVERSYKKGWSDGLVWCGSSGLYFSTQHIDLSYPSFSFHCYFTAVQKGGKEDRRQSKEIHNVRRIIAILSCLKNTTIALIQHSGNFWKRNLSSGRTLVPWEPASWLCFVAVRVYERLQIIFYEIRDSNHPIVWCAFTQQKCSKFISVLCLLAQYRTTGKTN